MTITRHNIAGIPAPQGYSHATAARGSRIIHISGQVGTDESGAVVPGGLAEQTARAIQNVALALAAADASMADLVKVTFYVVNWHPGLYEELARGSAIAHGPSGNPNVALTLIGVAALFTPELLIEVEAVAVAA